VNVVYALLAERCDEHGIARLDSELAEPLLTGTQRVRSLQRTRRSRIAAAGGVVL
jgi:hypothetical protein